jgi:hypothetical protein
VQVGLLVVEDELAGVATIGKVEEELHLASGGNLVAEVGPTDNTGLHRITQMLSLQTQS